MPGRQTIERTSLLRRGAEPLVNEVDGQVFMMSLERGKYFALSGTAAAIWSCLQQPTTPENIVADLRSRYDVDEETCMAQVMAFLESLAANGIVEKAR